MDSHYTGTFHYGRFVRQVKAQKKPHLNQQYCNSLFYALNSNGGICVLLCGYNVLQRHILKGNQKSGCCQDHRGKILVFPHAAKIGYRKSPSINILCLK